MCNLRGGGKEGGLGEGEVVGCMGGQSDGRFVEAKGLRYVHVIRAYVNLSFTRCMRRLILFTRLV